MKILLINKFLYPKGGDAISTLTTGKILASKGHEVNFWGMSHKDNPKYPYQDYFVPEIDYETSNGIASKAKSAINILYSFEAKNKIKRLLNEFTPDIVHLNNFAHQISPSILDAIKQHNIPAVMTMRDYKMVCPTYSMLANGQICEKCKGGRYYYCGLNRCTKGSLVKSLINVVEMHFHHHMLHIYDKIDLYISPSQFLKEKVQEMGLKGEVVYLPNCVDIDNFHPMYDWKEESIVYVGRISHEKGVETLIDAVKDFDITLKIIGDGPLKETLQTKVQTERINNVKFLGYKTGAELHSEIQKSMFLVIPSECYENNPRTVIEAFALGKPAIGARIGGIPELVKDSVTGYTYRSGDVMDLKRAIQTMLENKLRIGAMGQNGRELVKFKLNSETHYEQLMKIYERAIQKSQNATKHSG